MNHTAEAKPVEMSEAEIRQFWNTHPCGQGEVGAPGPDIEAFFDRYDRHRYAHEGHILKRLDAIDFKGKRVLEIGLGQGADAEQIIRRGAIWSGVDLTPESVDRLKTRMRLRNLSYERIERASALALPFADNTFDMVFSHGVLHHIPEIRSAQKEIARVLKPGGSLIAMLYSRYSLNYLVSIGMVRRAALASLYLARAKGKGSVAVHLENARRLGLGRYLRMKNFIHANTDGPSNPYSKVYGLREVANDFPDFKIERHYRDYMHAPPLPVSWLRPFAGVLGWHLWVHLTPSK